MSTQSAWGLETALLDLVNNQNTSEPNATSPILTAFYLIWNFIKDLSIRYCSHTLEPHVLHQSFEEIQRTVHSVHRTTPKPMIRARNQVCTATSCVYLESNFYTACDCDDNGQKRSEWGADWWREFTHCEDFSCHHASNVVPTGGVPPKPLLLSHHIRTSEVSSGVNNNTITLGFPSSS